jgi:hypothetical protein
VIERDVDEWNEDFSDDDFADDDDVDTVACPSCQQQVYDQAYRCPNCGYYLSDVERQPQVNRGGS